MRRLRGLGFVLGLGCLLLAGLAAWQRHFLLTQYHLYKLDRAGDTDRDCHIDALCRLGEAAIPGLLDRLQRDEAFVTSAVAPALTRLGQSWPADDPRRARLAEQLANRYAAFSPSGQACALDLVPELIPAGDAARTACRELTRLGLGHTAAEQRIAAVRLALRQDIGHLEAVKPLLNDPAAEVRRAALLAVGPHAAVVPDDDLIHWLHDADAEVRRLCRTALRSRGLRERDVEMGRLLTSPDPLERMKLFRELDEDTDVDVGVWLARLSQDPVPAVRAAAARHAAERQVESFGERLRAMAETDPDETIRQLARTFLEQAGQPRRGAVIPVMLRQQP